MATFPQITSPPQASAEVLVNGVHETLESGAVYGKAHLTTSGLTWGYYGGRWGGFSVAAGTFTLTGSSANYIVVEIATGVTTCSASNTNWNDSANYARVYKLTTSASAVTATEDHREGPGGIKGAAGAGGGDMVLASVQTNTGAKTFNDATLKLAGSSSGAGTLKAPAAASTYTWTLPAATGTLLYSGGALGTPASGTLTSCTGLPLTTGVTGVLPVANYATGTPTGSKFVRDDGVLAVPSGSGDALVANPLSQFAATTSAQLAGVISDETGSGALVFATSPTLVTPALGTPASGALNNCTKIPQVISFACSDESTALTTGTNKIKLINPFGSVFNVTGVVASLSTAQTSGSIFTVDINEAGTSILSTKLTIDNTETNSSTAATAAVISDASIAAYAEIEVDIDQVGDGTAKGLKVYILGYPS